VSKALEQTSRRHAIHTETELSVCNEQQQQQAVSFIHSPGESSLSLAQTLMITALSELGTEQLVFVLIPLAIALQKPLKLKIIASLSYVYLLILTFT
jgi:hypothetical protein